MKRIAIVVVVVLIVIGAAMFVRGVQQGAAPTLSGGPQQPAWSEEAPLSAQAQRGKYLALAGDCVGCHSIRGGQAYAGGLALPTPFGTLYTPNITPDPETGIGHWTADDFWRAMHEGKSIDGSMLYPAFPYTNYTKVTREDSDAMFAFLQAVQPVREPSRPHELRFPYNQRKLLAAWRALYFNQGVYENDAAQSAQWNRGAYLVEGLGHCNACHAARNILGAVADDDYAGGLIPIQDWYAPSLSSREETGLGRWEIADIVNLLKTGVSSRSAVYGPMAAVVHFSLQHMTNEDIAAMAVYLKSQQHEDAARAEPQVRPSETQAVALLEQGAAIYKKHCADCHQPDGKGVPRVYPPLAGNQSILMPYPINAIRMVLVGGFPPSTAGNPRPYGMPPFSQDLSDQEVAAVVTYIRQSWGNSAVAVSPADVARASGIAVD
ncbi:MAG: cytochrome c [Pseudomonadota bacterium]|nr:cytochrome c [Pseudomonadota bacterium]